MSEPILDIREIRKSYGSLHVSDGVSFSLLPGEIHALIGPNGAGKSTLIGQIAGNIRSDSGSIYFLGKNITSMTTAKRAHRGLARTFQVSALAMEYTVLENVVLGALGRQGNAYQFFKPVMKNEYLVSIAQGALVRANLLDQSDKLTHELSHGQRRQLEIAIALALAP